MRQLYINQKITDRSSLSFQKYLNDIQGTPLLTSLEEKRFAKMAKEGDDIAKNILIEANLRFVISVAKQYSSPTVPLEDLVNEGNYGLIEAANRFDESTGFKFISYAVHWIRRYILEYLNTSAQIRLPINKVQGVGEINRVIARLEQKLQREVTMSDLIDVKDINIEGKTIEELLRIKGTHVLHYNRKNSDESSEDIIDSYASDDAADKLLMVEEEHRIVKDCLEILVDKEKEVIIHLYGLDDKPPKTLQETGDIYGQSRERIRQIKKKALIKMKKVFNG